MSDYFRAMMLPQTTPRYPQYTRPNILRNRNTPSVQSRTPQRRFPGPFGPQYHNLLREEGILRQVTKPAFCNDGSIIIQIKNEVYQDQNQNDSLQRHIPRESQNPSEGIISRKGNCPECEAERANSSAVEDPENAVLGTEVEIVEIGSPSSVDSDRLVMDLPEDYNTWVASETTDVCKIRLRRESSKSSSLKNSPRGNHLELEYPDEPSNNDSTDEHCCLSGTDSDRGKKHQEPSPSSRGVQEEENIPPTAGRNASIETGTADLNPENEIRPPLNQAANSIFHAKVRSSPVRSPVEPRSYYAKQHWKKILLQMFINQEKLGITRKGSISKKGLLVKVKRGPSKATKSDGIRRVSPKSVHIKKSVVDGRRKPLAEGTAKTSANGRLRRSLRSNKEDGNLTSLPEKCRKFL